VVLWVGERGKNSHLPTARLRFMSHVLFSPSHIDWITNEIGVQEFIAEIQFDRLAEFNAAQLGPFTVDGEQYGTYKTTGQLSFLKMDQAGHEIPAFQPKASLEVFKQTINKEGLHST
jgi:carboxypeptidase C (cathepsin A)